MIEKRFTKQEVYDGINRYRINESNFIVEILDDGIPMHYSTIVNRLNEQHKTITRLEKENEQIRNKKERYKRLSEIRQQQINNRILTIKEFINNCSDNKVRSVLKELFYSEVNEYDLSSENRKLLNENEKLKKEKDYYKRELQKELVCQAIIDGRKKND